MTRRSRIGTPGLLLRHLASDVTASVLVAALVFLTVLVVALAPRALAHLGTAELHYELARISPLARDLAASGFLAQRPPTEPRDSAEAILGPSDDVLERIPEKLPPVLASIIGAPSWTLTTVARGATPLVPRGDALPVLALVIDLDWLDRVEFVDGAAPSPWEGDELDESTERPPVDIALSAATADMLELEIGDVFDYTPAPLRLSGVYDVIDPEDPYWEHVPALREGVLRLSDFRLVVQASAYIDPESSVGLFETVNNGRLYAWYPVDGDKLDYADVPQLLKEVDTTLAVGASLSSSSPLTFETGFPAAVQETVARVTSVSALLALAASGPIGVVFAVFALGVQSVIERRRAALALASARGAGSWSLRGAMLLEGLIIALPAAAIAIWLAGVLLPARIDTAALVLPAVLALAPPVLLVVTTSPTSVRGQRTDTRVRSTNRRRLIIEAAVVGLAALSLFLLARRGLVASSEAVGIDPLLAATPLLLSVSVCLVVLRLYPVPLLGMLKAMRRRRGATGLLGAARAVRQPALGFSAALALVVGISVAVFSVVMSTTIASALGAATTQAVGADIRVESVRLDAEVAESVNAVPGVFAVAGTQLVPNRSLQGRLQVDINVILADTDALRLVRPDLPDGLSEKVGGRIPVLISEDLADRFPTGDATLEQRAATIAGTLPSAWFPGQTERWVLVDAAFVGELTGGEFNAGDLLVATDPGVDPADVAPEIQAVVSDAQSDDNRPGVRVIDRTTQLADARAAPTISGLELALALAALGALLLSVLTVVLASVTAAASRHRILGVMRTLGMSPRQVSGLILWELAPVAITAVLAGTALGLVLPWIVTGALDLRPFVGGTVSPVPSVVPLAVAVTAAGFILVVALAGAIAVAIGRRLDPSSILRMGAE
jgi:putative ABC transport system permease protein